MSSINGNEPEPSFRYEEVIQDHSSEGMNTQRDSTPYGYRFLDFLK